jgi:hypothetical protein
MGFLVFGKILVSGHPSCRFGPYASFEIKYLEDNPIFRDVGAGGSTKARQGLWGGRRPT